MRLQLFETKLIVHVSLYRHMHSPVLVVSIGGEIEWVRSNISVHTHTNTVPLAHIRTHTMDAPVVAGS